MNVTQHNQPTLIVRCTRGKMCRSKLSLASYPTLARPASRYSPCCRSARKPRIPCLDPALQPSRSYPISQPPIQQAEQKIQRRQLLSAKAVLARESFSVQRPIRDLTTVSSPPRQPKKVKAQHPKNLLQVYFVRASSRFLHDI